MAWRIGRRRSRSKIYKEDKQDEDGSEEVLDEDRPAVSAGGYKPPSLFVSHKKNKKFNP